MLQLEKLESNEGLEIKKQEQDLKPVVLSGSMLLQSTENHVLFKELEKYKKIDNENYLYGEKLNKHINILNASLINGTYLVLGTGLMMLNQTMTTVLLGISVGILNANLPELTKVKRLKNMWKKVIPDKFWYKKTLENQKVAQKETIENILHKDETISLFVKLYKYFDYKNSNVEITQEEKNAAKEHGNLNAKIKDNLNVVLDYYVSKEKTINDQILGILKSLETDLMSYFAKTVKLKELIKEFENVSLEDNEVFSQKNNQKAIIDLLEDYDFKKSKYEL